MATKKHYLLPGAYIATTEVMEISTILGSCVAVALYDPKTKISGLCHYLLARILDMSGPIGRYGDQAIPMLFDEMVELGAQPRSIVAKVYGGANVLGNVSIGQEVGKKNIAIAHEVLRSIEVSIVEEDTGGNRGRKLLFVTDTFNIQQRFMEESRTHSRPAFAPSALRALIIDPAPRAHGNFEKILAQAGITIIRTVSDVFDAFGALNTEKPDVLIFGLPNKAKSELQLIRDLKKMSPSLPPFFVYSLGTGGGLQATQALELGAQDFVHSDAAFDLEALKSVAQVLVEKIGENNLVKRA